MAQTQVYYQRIMVTEYKSTKERNDRRDLGFACQMRNYLAQIRGVGEWDHNRTNQFSFDNPLWLHQELLPHLISTQPSIDPLMKKHKRLCTLEFLILIELWLSFGN